MDLAERALQRQIALTILNSAAYAVWQGAQLTFFSDTPNAGLISLIGAALWVVSLVMILVPIVSYLRKRKAVGETDERMARNSLRAVAAGYWTMLIAVGVLFPVSLLLPVVGIDVARILAIVAVATPGAAFAILEARDAREA
jgi:uncharacterized iron-regulated membrane protein